MSEFRKVEDVLEAAIRIEREGVQLYNKLYERIESPQAKEVFSFLAAEEEKYIGVFRQMLDEVADYQPRYNYPGEYGLFVKGVASYLFEKIEKAQKLLSANNIDEVLDAGIELEKETIKFYSELVGQFDSSQKEVLEKVINEEQLHQQKLTSLKNNIEF